MTDYIVNCPRCGQVRVVWNAEAGGTARCGMCGSPVALPGTPAVPAPQAPPAVAPAGAPGEDPPDAAAAGADPNNRFGPALADGRHRYVLVDRLGQDSLGVVYRTYDRASSRYVAVKFVLGETTRGQMAQFDKTAQKAARLRHPAIVPVVRLGHRQNQLYIVTEFIPALPSDATGIRETALVTRLVRDAALAVSFAHTRGVVHGDLSPSSILVASDAETERVYVKDFGLAIALDTADDVPAASGAGWVKGTPAFMAPERAEGNKAEIGPQSDVYSLGATLYSLLAGRPPFEGEDALAILERAVDQTPVPLRQLRPDLPGELTAIVERSMSRDKSARPVTANELADDLTAFLKTLPLREQVAAGEVSASALLEAETAVAWPLPTTESMEAAAPPEAPMAQPTAAAPIEKPRPSPAVEREPAPVEAPPPAAPAEEPIPAPAAPEPVAEPTLDISSTPAYADPAEQEAGAAESVPPLPGAEGPALSRMDEEAEEEAPPPPAAEPGYIPVSASPDAVVLEERPMDDEAPGPQGSAGAAAIFDQAGEEPPAEPAPVDAAEEPLPTREEPTGIAASSDQGGAEPPAEPAPADAAEEPLPTREEPTGTAALFDQAGAEPPAEPAPADAEREPAEAPPSGAASVFDEAVPATVGSGGEAPSGEPEPTLNLEEGSPPRDPMKVFEEAPEVQRAIDPLTETPEPAAEDRPAEAPQVPVVIPIAEPIAPPPEPAAPSETPVETAAPQAPPPVAPVPVPIAAEAATATPRRRGGFLKAVAALLLLAAAGAVVAHQMGYINLEELYEQAMAKIRGEAAGAPGTLEIAVEPAPQEVIVDGKPVNAKKPTHTVPSGRRQVTIVFESGFKLEKTVEVAPGKPAKLEVRAGREIARTWEALQKWDEAERAYQALFEKTPEAERGALEDDLARVRFKRAEAQAVLRIESEPSGAEVLLDGKAEGRTPRALTVLEPGEHAVELRREGYAPESRKITYVAGTKESLRVVLKPLTGKVLVQGVETGDRVRIIGAGGVELQSLEVKADGDVEIDGVRVGACEVVVDRAGHEPGRTKVAVESGGLTRLVSPGLKERPGVVSVQTEPEGAEVFFDGASVGKTPLSLKDVPPGVKKARIVHPERSDWEGEVRVRGGRPAEVKVTLPALGSLVVEVHPEGSTIRGALQGVTRVEAKVKAGTHRLSLQHAEAGEVDRAAVVKPGEETVEKVDLWEERGKEFEKAGKIDEAVRAFEAAKGSSREKAIARILAGLCDRGDDRIKAGEWAKAREIAAQALKLSPQHPRSLELDRTAVFMDALARAEAAAREKEWKKARGAADEALRARPEDARARALYVDAAYRDAMGTAEEAVKAKEWKKARAAAEEALQAREGDDAARTIREEAGYQDGLGRAEAAAAAKDWRTAIQAADEALSFRPNDARARELSKTAAFEDGIARGRDLEKRGKWTDAKAAYEQALKARPGDAESAAAIARFAVLGWEEVATFSGHAWCAAFRPGASTIASGRLDKTVKVLDLKTGRETRSLEGHAEAVHGLAFGADGKLLATAGKDGTVKVWDGETGTLVRSISAHAGAAWAVSFRPDGKVLASAGEDKTVRLWNLETGEEARSLAGHEEAVVAVAFSPGGALIASGGADRAVKLWGAESGTVRHTLEGHEAYVWSVAFRPDGRMLATASGDKTVKLWDPESGALTRTLSGHGDFVRQVAFSPDGRLLASGSGDKSIKVWDVASGAEIKTLYGHTGHIWSVAFDADGRRLVSAGTDATKLWGLKR
jgi:WD40 repeat protein/serine/threonine protein kinase